MSAKEQIKKEIIEAYIFLRTNNMTIPSETLEFMKDASLKALEKQFVITDVVAMLPNIDSKEFSDYLIS